VKVFVRLSRVVSRTARDLPSIWRVQKGTDFSLRPKLGCYTSSGARLGSRHSDLRQNSDGLRKTRQQYRREHGYEHSTHHRRGTGAPRWRGISFQTPRLRLPARDERAVAVCTDPQLEQGALSAPSGISAPGRLPPPRLVFATAGAPDDRVPLSRAPTASVSACLGCANSARG
jgi:hypothetical protein